MRYVKFSTKNMFPFNFQQANDAFITRDEPKVFHRGVPSFGNKVQDTLNDYGTPCPTPPPTAPLGIPKSNSVPDPNYSRWSIENYPVPALGGSGWSQIPQVLPDPFALLPLN